MEIYKSEHQDPCIVIDSDGVTISDFPFFIRTNSEFIEYLDTVSADINKEIKKMQIKYVDDHYDQHILLKS